MNATAKQVERLIEKWVANNPLFSHAQAEMLNRLSWELSHKGGCTYKGRFYKLNDGRRKVTSDSGAVWRDPYKYSLFPNPPNQASLPESLKQFFGTLPAPYHRIFKECGADGESVSKSQLSTAEIEATNVCRRIVRDRRWMNTKKGLNRLIRGYIPSYINQVMFPTCPGATKSYDYVTFMGNGDLNGALFNRRVYDSLMSKSKNSEELAGSASVMLTNYHLTAPATVLITAHDDSRLTPKDGLFNYSDVQLELIKSAFDKGFKRNFAESKKTVIDFLEKGSLPDMKINVPKMHGDKAPGLWEEWPDGTQFSKYDQTYMTTKEWDLSNDYNAQKIVNNLSYRIAHYLSPQMIVRLRFFLDNAREYSDPKTIGEAFLLQAITLTSLVQRRNNQDTVDRDSLATKKLRIGNITIESNRDKWEPTEYVTVVNAYLSGLKLREAFENILIENGMLTASEHINAVLKLRLAYAMNNAVFGCLFILLSTALMKPMEEGPFGFASNRKIVLDKTLEFGELINNLGRVIGVDRSNSEKFISQNWWWIKTLLPEWLAVIIEALMTVVQPGKNGLIVTISSMLSGQPATTLITFVVGLIGTSQLLAVYTTGLCDAAAATAVLLGYIGLLFSLIPETSFALEFRGIQRFRSHQDNPFFRILPRAGTDDYPIQHNDAYQSLYLAEAQAWAEKVFLTFEEGESVGMFGMNIYAHKMDVRSSLAVGKWFPVEPKDLILGDVIMMKVFCHLVFMDENDANIIVEEYAKAGFGDLWASIMAMANFMVNRLARFGFAVDPIFETGSMTSELIFGTLFDQDLIGKPTYYPVEKSLEYLDLFSGYIDAEERDQTPEYTQELAFMAQNNIFYIGGKKIA